MTVADLRVEFALWRERSREEGWEGTNQDFVLACRSHLHRPDEATPAEWMCSAEDVYWDAYVEMNSDEIWAEAADADWEPPGHMEYRAF